MNGDPLAEIYGMTSDADKGSSLDISAGATGVWDATTVVNLEVVKIMCTRKDEG